MYRSECRGLEKVADLVPGAALLFSHDGTSIKAQVLADADGLLELKNDVASLKDLLDGLIDSILDLKVLDAGGTGNWPLDPASLLAINDAKAQFDLLLK